MAKDTGKPAARLTDMGDKHDGFPATPIMEGSPAVLINGRPAARQGDALVPHTKPKKPSHPRNIAEGSASVFINGKPAARLGDAISCGGVIIGGSGNVFIGDRPKNTNPILPEEWDAYMHHLIKDRITRSLYQRQELAASLAVKFRGESGGIASWQWYYTRMLGREEALPALSELHDPLQRKGLLRARKEDRDFRALIGQVEEEEEEVELPKETLYIGVFFDGTWRDREVDAARSDADISNIAKLYDLYDEYPATQKAIYIRGIGIETRAPVNLPTQGGYYSGTDVPVQEPAMTLPDGREVEHPVLGSAFAVGHSGASERIREALDEVVQAMGDPDYYDWVVLDVFGFSRGAALARHFVNVINDAVPTRWHPHDWPFQLPMEVRFVGLFDTVASLYIPRNNHTFDFNINLGAGSAQRVVHLTAAHEVRANFPLSSLADANGSLPGNFTEHSLPGVHADLGGGYENPNPETGENVEWIPLRRHVGVLSRDAYARPYGGAAEFASLPYGEWRSQTLRAYQRQTEAEGRTVREFGDHIIEGEERHTRKELAIHYLHMMHEYAVQAGVPLRALNPEGREGHRIPPDLTRRYQRWESAGSDLSAARNTAFLGTYIHTSEQRGSLVNAPTRSGLREVIANTQRDSQAEAPAQELAER
ncbi:MAG: type VI secretion system PAAR protein [Ectothiorhodospiraceae bacterium]|nr:type VI secretion system PAAR protein [Ectothiorhodospiraceae bacterium]